MSSLTNTMTSSSNHEPSVKVYYAVRCGYNVKNCLFFSWEDCKTHVVPDSYFTMSDGVEYRVFHDFHQAELYLFPNTQATVTINNMNPYGSTTMMVPTMIPPPPSPAHAAVATTGTVSLTGGGDPSTVPPTANTRKNHEKPGTKWMLMFNKLLQFYQANGHTRIPDSQRDLLAWCKKQKNYYRLFVDQKPTPMTTLKIQLLSGANFNFRGPPVVSSKTDASEQVISPPPAVAAAVAATTPATHSHANDIILPSASQQQVPAENNNLKPSASVATADSLASEIMDHPNTVRSYKPTKHWNRCFDRLHAYKLAHNGSIEIHKLDKENADLHQWCTEQRAQFKAWKLGKGNYLQEKIERLESLGFEFNYKSWEERIEMLIQYREEKIKTMQNRAYGKKTFETHGVIKIPESHPELGKWWRNFRARVKTGKVEPHLIEQVKSLGFDPYFRVNSVSADVEASDKSGELHVATGAVAADVIEDDDEGEDEDEEDEEIHFMLDDTM